MIKKLSFMVILVAALASLTAAQDRIITSVCLITDVGNVNDGTFNEFAYNGMVRAVEEFGLESTFIETQSPSDYANNLNTCIDNSYDIMITVGFSLADATREAAMTHPDLYFIGVDQDFTSVDPLLNLIGVQFREDQAGFLAGVMAALMTETDIVAGVYGLDIPPVVKFRTGFESGARYINPEIRTLGVYIPDFQVPDQGADAAASFIGENADVIFGAGGPTGTGGIIYAAQQDVYVIGVDQDQYFTDFGAGDVPGAEFLLTSAIKRVDNGVYELIRRMVENPAELPQDSNYVLEIANDGIGFAPAHDADVPQEVTDQLIAVFDMLEAGTLVTGAHPVSGAPVEDMAALIASRDDLMLLQQALAVTGLAAELAMPGAMTFFAPTDAAFNDAAQHLGVTLDELLANTDMLREMLHNQLVDERAITTTMIAFLEIEALEARSGTEIAFVVENGIVSLSLMRLVEPNIHASNGVIHVVDRILE